MSAKLERVHPTLVAKVLRILVRMASLGHPMMVTDGARTAKQQNLLYLQGRDPAHPGRIVTNADGYKKASNHQIKADGYGHAVDCCFVVDGRPSWDEKLPWLVYGSIAVDEGLEWGGNWNSNLVDRPHIELPDA